jgi:hypothetical protein
MACFVEELPIFTIQYYLCALLSSVDNLKTQRKGGHGDFKWIITVVVNKS